MFFYLRDKKWRDQNQQDSSIRTIQNKHWSHDLLMCLRTYSPEYHNHLPISF